MAAAPTCCPTSHSDSSPGSSAAGRGPGLATSRALQHRLTPQSPPRTTAFQGARIQGQSPGPEAPGSRGGPLGLWAGLHGSLTSASALLPSAPSTRLHPVQDNDLPPLRHLCPLPETPACHEGSRQSSPASLSDPRSSSLPSSARSKLTGLGSVFPPEDQWPPGGRSWSGCPFTSFQLCLSITLNTGVHLLTCLGVDLTWKK